MRAGRANCFQLCNSQLPTHSFFYSSHWPQCYVGSLSKFIFGVHPCFRIYVWDSGSSFAFLHNDNNLGINLDNNLGINHDNNLNNNLDNNLDDNVDDQPWLCQISKTWLTEWVTLQHGSKRCYIAHLKIFKSGWSNQVRPEASIKVVSMSPAVLAWSLKCIKNSLFVVLHLIFNFGETVHTVTLKKCFVTERRHVFIISSTSSCHYHY